MALLLQKVALYVVHILLISVGVFHVDVSGEITFTLRPTRSAYTTEMIVKRG